MTKFMNKSFSSPANNNKYRSNYDRVFGKQCEHDEACKRVPPLGRRWCLKHLREAGIEPEKPETD